MSEGGGLEGPQHPVLGAGAVVAAVAAEVLARSGLSLSTAEAQGALRSLNTGRQVMEAAHLHLVRMLLEKEENPLHPGAVTRHWLADELGIGTGAAHADTEAAKATEPEDGVLRGLGAALGAGQVTRAHVDVARRAVAALPTGMVRERREDVDRVLTDHARAFRPTGAAKLARYLVDTVDPAGVEAYADEAFERRSWTTRADATGMVRAEGALDPAEGAEYLAVLDHLSAPERGRASDEDGHQGPGAAVDLRTKAQRNADAQVRMARLAAAQLELDSPGTPEPPRVVVHTTVEQLAWREGSGEDQPEFDQDDEPENDEPENDEPTAASHPGPATCEQTGPISSQTLHRHACDAVIERVVLDRHGAIVAMESTGRLADRALRRALGARDGGCAWPGCTAPVTWCEAHHVTWWSRGGPSRRARRPAGWHGRAGSRGPRVPA